MTCRATCVKPSPTNAHCGACHQTFGGITGFDRHRRAGECLKARDLGMHADRNGVWREAGPDPTKRAIWPQRPAPEPEPWRWEPDGNGGWVSAPRCYEPTCPDFGSWDFGEGTCPTEHADPAVTARAGHQAQLTPGETT